MKYTILALAVSLLLASDANAVKLTQKAVQEDDDDFHAPEEDEDVQQDTEENEEAELDATQQALNDLESDVQNGSISEAEAEDAGKQILHHAEEAVPEAAE